MCEPGFRRILVVDDSEPTREVIRRNLEAAGYAVRTASSVAEAVKELDREPVDLVVTDLKMPGPSGMELVRHIRENYRYTEVIMITGYPSIEDAVAAVKIGADEFLAKPFTDRELLAAVSSALEKLASRRTTDKTVPLSMPGLIGESAPMQALFRAIEKVARTTATVLITGESGTGKELVARAIHYGSNRRNAPFVPVNCATIPEGLLESELFGHTRGAFTGATESRAGFFQAADGGTVFLDEIGELPLSMQVKLLRFLQEKEITMVGSSRIRKLDVRIIAATNRNLRQLVDTGRFREDLYYRLNIVTLDIPPLRERGRDILLLARHFSRKYSEMNGLPEAEFSPNVQTALLAYHWPGNVRELENTVHRLVVMREERRIEVPDLPQHMRYTVMAESAPYRTLREMEREYIRQVLASTGGNVSQAARILGIDRKTLRARLHETP